MSRVLFVQGVTIPGGAHRSLILLAQGLISRNVHPIVVTSEKGYFTDQLENSNIEYRIVRMGMWRKGKNIPNIPIALYKLNTIIKKEKIDLIHANTMWDNPYCVFPAQRNNIGLVCHIRSRVFPAMVRKYFLNRADRVIAISKNILEPIVPLLEKNSTVVYNGVDTNLFHPAVNPSPFREKLGISPNTPLIGIVSRIDPLKGQKLFLEAARAVHDTHPEARFLIVGGYGHKQEWFARKIIDTVNSEPFKSFCFYIDRQKNTENIYAALDVHVLPSYEEGLGMSNLEAMATGKPVISTRVGGIPEYLRDGENGFLTPIDSGIIAEKIRILLNSPHIGKNMGRMGYKQVMTDFSLEKYVENVYSIYRKILVV